MVSIGPSATKKRLIFQNLPKLLKSWQKNGPIYWCQNLSVRESGIFGVTAFEDDGNDRPDDDEVMATMGSDNRLPDNKRCADSSDKKHALRDYIWDCNFRATNILVAKSSTEAELIGQVEIMSRGLGMRYTLLEMGYEVGMLVLYQDNKSTIQMLTNAKGTSSRTRHIHIRYFFVRVTPQKKFHRLQSPLSSRN